MFSINITPTSDLLAQANNQIFGVLYGQTYLSYTNNQGTTIGAGDWFFYNTTISDYDLCPAGGLTQSFVLTGTSTFVLNLPGINVQSCRMVFSLGQMPQINVVGGQPQAANQATTDFVFDWVEFTYNQSNTLYINTTMVDQFGFPIQLQLSPAVVTTPNGAGVQIAREDVMSQFTTWCNNNNTDFLFCIQDAFGKTSSLRIQSPGDALNNNLVAGVVANTFGGPPNALANGVYYYGVSALNSSGAEGAIQPQLAIATITEGQSVEVSWSPNSLQPADTASYNVYRGTAAAGVVSWVLLGNVTAASLGSNGGSFADTGNTGSAVTPHTTGLANFFDGEITSFFTNYLTNTLTLTATDGLNPGNGYVYTFSGKTATNASNQITSLALTLSSVVDSSGNTVATPPVPVGTAFPVYYPFFNTNTFNSANPAPPAPFTAGTEAYPYSNIPPSIMVFAAEGCFADNGWQTQQIINSGSTAINTTAYSDLLGSLENQIVAAITRGIANTSIAPQNWGNGTSPSQLQPVAVVAPAGVTSSLTAGTTYYYAITAVNGNGETIASYVFSAVPTNGLPCVQVSWLPMSTAVTSFNVYRGTAANEINSLVASVSNSNGTANSYTDSGTESDQASPPVYFPDDQIWDVYDAFFHQPAVSINGLAYAGPYDDQGNWSSTLAQTNPSSVTINLGPWQG